jgi:hypothetical protein
LLTPVKVSPSGKREKEKAKEQNMKTITKSVLVFGAAALAATTALAGPGQPTEIVHFSTHVAFTNSGVEPSASGTVQATETMQRSVDKETLAIAVKGLTPGDPYSVVVTTVSNSTPLLLDGFNADSRGNAKLNFSNSGKRNTIGFLDGVLPLTGLVEVDIVNTNDAAVLSASRDEVTKLNYLVKKPMDDTAGNGESGTVTLSASTKKAKFSLTAAGLTASTDYVIVVDGTPVSTNTSTSKGVLKVNSSPTPSDVLGASNISLQDTVGTTILSTVVP